MYCKDCQELNYKCICVRVDNFFKENKHLMKENKKEVKKTRCLACWFNDCRCKKGLQNK